MLRHIKIIIASLFVFTGCAGVFLPSTGESFPEWVEAPPADTKKEYFGIGEGISLTRAKESALNDIAGKLGTEISSRIGSDVRQYGEQVRTLAHQVISARIHKTKLIHPRVLKSAKYDGNVYVLLSVSREAMARDARSRLKGMDQHLRQQWQGLPSLSRLQQFIRTQKLSPEMDRATALAITLQSLDSRFLSDDYLERYNGYRKKSDALLSKTRFRIRAVKAMYPIAQNLVSLLSREEIQSSVVGLNNRHSSRDPIIEVRGQLKTDNAFSSKFARLTVVLEVKDMRGNIISSRKYKAVGKSMNDFASARREAEEKLMKQWERQPVLNVIGLNL